MISPYYFLCPYILYCNPSPILLALAHNKYEKKVTARLQTDPASHVPPKKVLLAIILLGFAILFWAGNIYVSKVANSHIPPFLLNFLRWSGAGILLTPFALKHIIRDIAVIKSNWMALACFGVLSVSLYNSLLYLSAHTTSGINIAVISTLTPLITFIFAWLLYRINPTTNQIIGFVLGITGVLILIFQGSWNRFLELKFTLGDTWMLLAVIFWALYSVTLPKHKPKISGISLLYCTIILGLIIALPSVWLEYQHGQRWDIQPSDKWLIGYVCLFPSLLSYLCYNYGLATLGAIKTAMFFYLLPVFTAIISISFLNETLSSYHVIGQILVFIGFYFAVLKSA